MKTRTMDIRRTYVGHPERRTSVGPVPLREKLYVLRSVEGRVDGQNAGQGPNGAPLGCAGRSALARPGPSSAEPGGFAPRPCASCGRETDRFPVMVSVDGGDPKGLCESCTRGALACGPAEGRYCGVLWLVSTEPVRPSLLNPTQALGRA